MAKRTARSILTEASQKNEKHRQALSKFAIKSEFEPRLKAMISLASSEEGVTVLQEQLDSDPDLLACPNGTIDLTTGTIRPADPADLITRRSDVIHDPEATCRRWERFLLEIFDGDVELVEFSQRWIGYCLTGHTVEHALMLAYGPKGRGGKTAQAEAVKKLLGDHAMVAPFDTFARRGSDTGPRNDLARLAGARLVVASEGQAGRRMDEATVKQITGGDTVAARFLYGEHFEFRPRFKLWLITNHEPRIDGGDEAIWARIRQVPYMVSFRGREDRELEATLETELSGILNWAIEGCLKWREEGLGTARAIEESTAKFRAEEDTVGGFLDDRTAPEGEVEAVRLRSAFETYCEELGERPLSAAQFGRELATRGITRGGAQNRMYRGVSLR